MAKVSEPFGLLDFARYFLSANRITSYSQIHTDDLADWFRAFFNVPAFARLPDLYALCDRLGVRLRSLAPESTELVAVNTWYRSGEPTIHLRPDLDTRRAETSLGHELREVLETSFKRIKADYEGLDTANNKAMNPKSDQFASCLLMPASKSKQLCRELGYDALAFSERTARSLPSVILRMQHLFSGRSQEGPPAGIWLFEAPWELVREGTAAVEDLRVHYQAHLNGFSVDKGRTAESRLASLVFPGKHASAARVPIVTRSIESGCPIIDIVSGFDLWERETSRSSLSPCSSGMCRGGFFLPPFGGTALI